MAVPQEKEIVSAVAVCVPTIAGGWSQSTVDAYQKWESERKAVYEEYRVLLSAAKPADAMEAEKRRMKRALDIRVNLGAFPRPKGVSWEQHRSDEEAWRSKQPRIPAESMSHEDVLVFVRFLRDPEGTRAREQKFDDEMKGFVGWITKASEETDAKLAPYRLQHPKHIVSLLQNYAPREQLRIYQMPKEEFDIFVGKDLKKYEVNYEMYKTEVEAANKKRASLHKEPLELKPKNYHTWEIVGEVFSDSDDEMMDLLL